MEIATRDVVGTMDGKFSLIYIDPRLSPGEIEKYLALAWHAIYEVEYNYIFESFRGIYLNQEENRVDVTFQFASGSLANVGMICIDRETGDNHFDFPPRHLVERELAILSEALGTDVLAWERELRDKLMHFLMTGEEK